MMLEQVRRITVFEVQRAYDRLRTRRYIPIKGAWTMRGKPQERAKETIIGVCGGLACCLCDPDIQTLNGQQYLEGRGGFFYARGFTDGWDGYERLSVSDFKQELSTRNPQPTHYDYLVYLASYADGHNAARKIHPISQEELEQVHDAATYGTNAPTVRADIERDCAVARAERDSQERPEVDRTDDFDYDPKDWEEDSNDQSSQPPV